MSRSTSVTSRSLLDEIPRVSAGTCGGAGYIYRPTGSRSCEIGNLEFFLLSAKKMAPSALDKRFQSHVRSNSMPSKPHPLIQECNEHLGRLESSQSASSSSSSSIREKLDCLQDLHDCVEKLFQLPLAQRVIAGENGGKWMDERLDGSLRLLDACTAAKEAIVHTRECARELQSTMRRKRSGSAELEAEMKKYVTSRKVVRKAIEKTLRSSKAEGHRCSSPPSSMEDQESASWMTLASEVESVTLSALESLLHHISGPSRAKIGSWSFVSKLVHTRKVSCTREEDDRSAFSKADSAVQWFLSEKTGKPESSSELGFRLEELESSTGDLEEGLERLFKKLIRTRVSLLNVANH